MAEWAVRPASAWLKVQVNHPVAKGKYEITAHAVAGMREEQLQQAINN